MDGMTASDVALLNRDSNWGDNSFMWIFALLILMFGMGGGGLFGGRGPAGPDLASADQVNQGFMNQQLQQISLSSANNNYETARLIQTQTAEMMQQNNTNLINAIQGFNQVNLGIQNQTNVLSQQLQALQSKMDTCCCEIKTQMLQDRLADAQAQKVALQNEISNFQQSQYLLGQMGRWVGWDTSGAQTATGGT